MAKQYWLVPVSGFDDQVAVGETAAKARYAVFLAGKDAGYFGGPFGFRDFLVASEAPSKITEDQARARIGDFKAAGE
jgi:hypothetical protein